MNVIFPMEVVVTPKTTYIMIEYLSMLRRIYTDGRDWPKDFEPSFMGYSIGKWTDADPNGRYQTLEVETRLLKGPRAYDFNGIPLHADNETVVKERIFLDKANPDMMHDEIATFDHALIHPWKIVKTYVRVQNPIWFDLDLRGEQRAPAHRQGELHDERGRLPDAGQEEGAVAAGFAIFEKKLPEIIQKRHQTRRTAWPGS